MLVKRSSPANVFIALVTVLCSAALLSSSSLSRLGLPYFVEGLQAAPGPGTRVPDSYVVDGVATDYAIRHSTYKDTSRFLAHALENWATNLILGAKLSQIQAGLEAGEMQGGGALYQVETFDIEGVPVVDVRFVAFGPNETAAFRDYQTHPQLSTPPRDLPHSQLAVSWVFFTPGPVMRPRITDPTYTLILKGSVFRQMAAEEAQIRAAAAAAQARGQSSPGHSSGPDDRGPGREGGNSRPSAPGGSRPDQGTGGATSSGNGPASIAFTGDMRVLEGRMWADFNGDGFDDYCFIEKDSDGYRLLVKLSTGWRLEDRAKGKLIQSELLDAG